MPNVSLGQGAANTLVFGIGSHLKFAEQPNLDTAALRKRTDKDEFSKYNVAVNSMTVTPTSTLIEPNVIPITVEQFPGVPGPISIAGSFVIDALPRRMELLFRHLLNAPSANITQVAAGAGTGIGDATEEDYVTAGDLTAATTDLATAIDVNKGPVRLVVALGGTPTRGGNAPTASNPIRITISGTDYSDNAIVEDLTFTAATGPGSTRTTSSYFKTVNTGGITTNHAASPASAVLSGSFTVKGTPNRAAIEISSAAGYRLTPGLTVEAVNGNIPNTIVDSYINSLTWTAAREENVTYTFGLTGRLYTANLAPDNRLIQLGYENDGTASVVGDTYARGPSASGPYGNGLFAAIQDNQTPFAGYGVCLHATVGTTRVKFDHLTGASMTLDNATQFTPRLCTLFPGLAYNRQRTITGEIMLEYHSDDKQVVNDYLAGRTWDDVELVLGNVGLGAPADETRFIFDRIQLTEYPSLPVEDDDYITQTIRFMALPSSGTLADAVKIRTYYQEGVTVASLALRDLS